MKVPNSIFKAYDIRGIVETELTPEIVKLIGRAVGSESIEKGERGVVVGRDGRLSGPELSEALISGLIESGCHVVNIGMVPSPVVYFATHTKAASSGVMITGSHNPTEYNGLKIMIAGETLSAERIQDLYSRILESDFSNGHGTSTSINIDQDYIETLYPSKKDEDLSNLFSLLESRASWYGDKATADIYAGPSKKMMVFKTRGFSSLIL